MKTKQQIQEEIAVLRKQLEELEKPKGKYYLTIWESVIEVNEIKDLFKVIQCGKVYKQNDQFHGLGKFETREGAERCRAALIFILDLAKQYVIRPEDLCESEWTFNEMIDQGKDIIKAIEEGTHE